MHFQLINIDWLYNSHFHVALSIIIPDDSYGIIIVFEFQLKLINILSINLLINATL